MPATKTRSFRNRARTTVVPMLENSVTAARGAEDLLVRLGDRVADRRLDGLDVGLLGAEPLGDSPWG